MLSGSVIQRLMALLPGVPIREVLEELWGEVSPGLAQDVRQFSQAPGPESLLQLEEKVLHLLGQVAGGIVACGIALVHASPSLVAQAIRSSKLHSDEAYRHAGSRLTPVQFIGGLRVNLETPYLAADLGKRPGRRRAPGRRGPAGGGLYPVLAQLGIFEAATPAVQSEVARQATRNTSFEVAREALAERGCDLDVKQVRRITLAVGEAALNPKEDPRAGRGSGRAVQQRVGRQTRIPRSRWGSPENARRR